MSDHVSPDHLLQRLTIIDSGIEHLQENLQNIQCSLKAIQADLKAMKAKQSILDQDVRSLASQVAEHGNGLRTMGWCLAVVGLPLILAAAPVLIEHHLQRPGVAQVS